jgi:predicted DNA-binding ribbon-helix-helix protein
MANPDGKGESAPTNMRRLAVHGGLVRPSVYVRGSKVTISLEPSIWEAFQEIAAEQGKTVNELATEIEQSRSVGLSAAIRVYVIDYYRAVISRTEALRAFDRSRRRVCSTDG